MTGDATGIVTSRIADNFSDNIKFLSTDVLLAAHHGSSSHGSNNITWIKQTTPRYVLISNGTMYGHPHIQSYEAFKSEENDRLERDTLKHYVLVTRLGPGEKEFNKSYNSFLTKKGIFSTLTNGNLKVIFSEELGKAEKVEDIIFNKSIKAPIKKKGEKSSASNKQKASEINFIKKGVKITLYQKQEIANVNFEAKRPGEDKEEFESTDVQSPDVKNASFEAKNTDTTSQRPIKPLDLTPVKLPELDFPEMEESKKIPELSFDKIESNYSLDKLKSFLGLLIKEKALTTRTLANTLKDGKSTTGILYGLAHTSNYGNSRPDDYNGLWDEVILKYSKEYNEWAKAKF